MQYKSSISGAGYMFFLLVSLLNYTRHFFTILHPPKSKCMLLEIEAKHLAFREAIRRRDIDRSSGSDQESRFIRRVLFFMLCSTSSHIP